MLGLVQYSAVAVRPVASCTASVLILGRLCFALLCRRYITITTFLLLNLFIGVIVNSMMETKAEAEKKKEEAKSWAVATRLKTRTGVNFSEISNGVTGLAGGMGSMAGSMARKAKDAGTNAASAGAGNGKGEGGGGGGKDSTPVELE